MYLHLGQDTIIKTDQLLGIFDIETSTVSKISRDYLTAAQKENRVFNVSYEMPKSFTVCTKKKGNAAVYISQISPGTLLKRSKYAQDGIGEKKSRKERPTR